MITTSRNKLLFPIGIENTAIPRGYTERATTRSYELVHEAADKIDQHIRRRKLAFNHCDADGHCVEVATKKLWSMDQAASSCTRIREVFDRFDCAPKNPDAICGGAHIHVGIPDMKLRVQVFRGLLTLYFLPWIFGEPDDTDSMNNVINTKERVQDRIMQIFASSDRTGSLYYGPSGIMAGLLGPENKLSHKVMYRMTSGSDKETMVRLTHGTIELRFFEMAPTWEEQRLQIDFANKLIAWAVKGAAAWGHRWRKECLLNLMMTDAQFQKIGQEYALNNFQQLCQEIGVDWQAYIPFINRNLYPRWQEGRSRT